VLNERKNIKEEVLMSEHPLKILEKCDPNLLEKVQEDGAFALSEGTLSEKVKLLIAIALDASHGAVGGVKALAREALDAGASEDEILETIRVANFVCGVGSVYTAAHALKEIF
jgi:alkylhydroperoxidase/carboxymuconolactone decarboxylase family protein YurZ